LIKCFTEKIKILKRENLLFSVRSSADNEAYTKELRNSKKYERYKLENMSLAKHWHNMEMWTCI